MSDTPIAAAIDQSATGPKSVTTEGGTVTQHSLPEQIAADVYKRNRDVAASPFAALRKATVAFSGDV